MVNPVHLPGCLESVQASDPLLPADGEAARELAQAARSLTVAQVAADIAQPAYEKQAAHVEILLGAGPHGGERPRLAEAALVGLARCIVVRGHHDRVRAIGDLVTFGAAPAGVFVVLRIQHGLAKSAAAPGVAPKAAAHHAEEVLPPRRFTVAAEAPLVIARKGRGAIRPRDLDRKSTRL